MKGDFISFTFNGRNSDDLGITRVADGDRYSENLQPDINDKTAEVAGMDGVYYFGSDFKSREHEIKIAYDSLTEEQFREIRTVFGGKDIGELIFDERPYKKYLVKLTNPIDLSYVCFDEPDFEWEYVLDEEGNPVIGIYGNPMMKKVYPEERTTHRVYRGEGTITFIAYYPFAKSVFKAYPEEYKDSDWVISSGMVDEETYKTLDTYELLDSGKGRVKIYNAGDVNTGIRIYCPFSANVEGTDTTYTYPTLRITYSPFIDAPEVKEILLKDVQPQKIGEDIDGEPIYDMGFLIDTDTGLIYGIEDYAEDEYRNPTYTTSGTLYNQFIEAGQFFKLEPNKSIIDEATLVIEGGNESMRFFYDYLYM